MLALVPSLLIPLLSPGVGQSYASATRSSTALCLFVAGAVFFSLAFLLSTVFSDVWRPLLHRALRGGGPGARRTVRRRLSRYSLFRVMSGESYFRGGGLPWLGLIASAALSAAMLYGAAGNFARQDF